MKKNITLDEAAANVIKSYDGFINSLSCELEAPDISPEYVDNLCRQIRERSEKVIREIDAKIQALK